MSSIKKLNRIVFLSLADVSSSNGQGIYSRKVLPQIIDKLDSEKFESYLIAPKPHNSNMMPPAMVDDSHTSWLPKKKNRNIFWHIYAQILVFIYLLRIRPTSVVFSVKPSFIGIEFARRIVGFEKIILVEGLGRNNLKTLGGRFVVFFGNAAYRVLFKDAKAIYAAYQSALDWIQEFGVTCHKEVIPCGVDIDIFKPQQCHQISNSLNSSNIVIGYVGSFRDVHRLELLVSLLGNNERLHLRLVGNGERYNAIRSFVDSNDLSHRVEFTGEVSQAMIPELVQSCHIMWAFTDVSHWGVPIKAYEYLACNKFIIASQRKEFEFVKTHEFGLILESNDLTYIEKALNGIFVKAIDNDIYNIESFEYIKRYHNWQNFSKVADYVC